MFQIGTAQISPSLSPLRSIHQYTHQATSIQLSQAIHANPVPDRMDTGLSGSWRDGARPNAWGGYVQGRPISRLNNSTNSFMPALTHPRYPAAWQGQETERAWDSVRARTARASSVLSSSDFMMMLVAWTCKPDGRGIPSSRESTIRTSRKSA